MGILDISEGEREYLVLETTLLDGYNNTFILWRDIM